MGIVSKRVRPGMYLVTTDAGDEYSVCDTQFDDGWHWTITAVGELTSTPDAGLFATKREAMEAIEKGWL